MSTQVRPVVERFGSGTRGRQGNPGPRGTSGAVFRVEGGVDAFPGFTRLYNDTGRDWILRAVRATVETAPNGGNVLVDVNKNGVSVFTDQNQRPLIAPGQLTSGKVIPNGAPVISDGDYITVDVDASTDPAANLTVSLVLE
jgi:hypothetical protein